jgi:hypothetical protein
MVRRALALTAGQAVAFDVWNELDGLASFGQFRAVWRTAVRTLRRLAPAAVVVGPSEGFGPFDGERTRRCPPAGPQAHCKTFARDFLTFARDEDVLPDVYSWHDALSSSSFNKSEAAPRWIGNGSEVVANLAEMRALLAELGITRPMRFSVNEYMSSAYAKVSASEVGPTSAFHSCVSTGMHGPTYIFWANLTPFALKSGVPAPHVAFISNLERAEVRLGRAISEIGLPLCSTALF